jgi:hypothetical protein
VKPSASRHLQLEGGANGISLTKKWEQLALCKCLEARKFETWSESRHVAIKIGPFPEPSSTSSLWALKGQRAIQHTLSSDRE